MREVYDGSWHRPVGTGGGKVLAWEGKAGLVGAVTPSIDRHHAVMGALGERFVLYRLTVDDPRPRPDAGSPTGAGTQMRAELAAPSPHVLAAVDAEHPPRHLADDEVDQLVDLADFVVKARTAVERDGYDREVVVMPAAEAPGRLVGALGALLAGLEAVGADQRDRAGASSTKAAWDCVPDIRRRLLHALHEQRTARTSDLVTATGIPRNTTARALEDLALLHLVEGTRRATTTPPAWTWSLTEEAEQAWP